MPLPSLNRLKLLEGQTGLSQKKLLVLHKADPTNGKYLPWIARQVKTKKLRFPEDQQKVFDRLSQFHSLKKKEEFFGERDINQYPDYGTLALTLDQNLGVQTKGEKVRALQTEGTKLLNRLDNPHTCETLALYEVSTPEAAAKLFRHTEWCVKDPEYFNRYGPPFHYIEKNGEPFKLLHRKDQQCMDVYDKPTKIDEFETLGLDLSPLKSDSKWLCEYARDLLKARWPKAEKAISKDPHWAYIYARDILKTRWPEAEPTIAKDPYPAYLYAKDVLKGRWPEAEATIAKTLGLDLSPLKSDPRWLCEYARHLLKGRWPKAEPTIATAPYWAYIYARDFLKNRFPEAEKDIATDPYIASNYAKDVLKTRWPEVEPTIATNPHGAYAYAKDVLKTRWPEAETTIAKDPDVAFLYAKNVLKSPFPLGEQSIKTQPEVYTEYKKFLKTLKEQPQIG